MINLDLLSRSYFWIDKPVPYQIDMTHEIYITPIKVIDSEMFLSWIDILAVDKNAMPNPEYITMSYLEFLICVLILKNEEDMRRINSLKLASIFKLCLGVENQISIKFNERNKPYLVYGDIVIDSKHFDDIRRIILYQNLIHYNDEYVNPDVQQAMNELDEMRRKNIEYPSLERRIAIITAHSGLTKEVQLDMTYRSHSLLFEEVYGEVDYSTGRTAALIGSMFSKQKTEIEDWIYKKKHGKYDNYFTDVNTYQQSMGGHGSIHSRTINGNELNDFGNLIK